jgi:hypothetical protein
MRTRMIKEQKPIAMIIAGGMDGVAEELALFREHASPSPIYAARHTGGFASRLTLEKGGIPPVQIVEDAWLHEGGSPWTPEGNTDPRDSIVPPYGAIMQWLVKRIAANNSF